jgi:hypothetical protein
VVEHGAVHGSETLESILTSKTSFKHKFHHDLEFFCLFVGLWRGKEGIERAQGSAGMCSI